MAFIWTHFVSIASKYSIIFTSKVNPLVFSELKYSFFKEQLVAATKKQNKTKIYHVVNIS